MNYPILGSIDVDIRRRILNHIEKEGMVDLETLVTPTHLEAFKLMDVENLYSLSIYLFLVKKGS